MSVTEQQLFANDDLLAMLKNFESIEAEERLKFIADVSSIFTKEGAQHHIELANLAYEDDEVALTKITGAILTASGRAARGR